MKNLGLTGWCCVLGLGLFVAGCGGKSGPVAHQVRGQVQWQGQPLPEAVVVFHPLSDQPAGTPKPMGVCDAAGRFELTTFATRDGALAGDYAITVQLRAPSQIGDEVTRDGPNMLPPRYALPDQSGLRATVVAGANELPPLNLSAP